MSDFDTIAEHLCDDGDSYEIATPNGTWTFRLRIVAYTVTCEEVEDPELVGDRLYCEITAEHLLPNGYHREWTSSLGGIDADADARTLDASYDQVLSELLLEIA